MEKEQNLKSDNHKAKESDISKDSQNTSSNISNDEETNPENLTDKSPEENDFKFNNVLIDKKSAELLKGSEIDFVSELIGDSFKISNPQSKSSCGCGVSFSL